MTGLGKTWLECFLVNECKKLGKRVLICSLEMTPERIYSRLDSIRFCLPYSKFRDASLELSVEEKWKKELEILEKEPDSNDVLAVGKEGIKSVSDILSIVEEYKPDIVFVDSAYRLEPTRGSKDTWSSNYSVVKELQIAAEKTDIPWVCSSQLWEEESGSGKRMVVKQTIKYAKEWLIDPDVVIVISQDEDLRLIKQMKVELRKVRDGDGKKVEGHINFDRDVMNFSEVGSASIFDFSAGGVTTDPADIAVSYE
jgi:replicative DNA helicase